VPTSRASLARPLALLALLTLLPAPTGFAAPSLPAGGLQRLADPASGAVQSVAVSPDGTTVATATARGGVQLWRVEGGGQAHVLSAETAATSVAFSADGTRLLAVYSDGSVRLWNPRDGTMVQRLMAHPRGTTAAALSPDGRVLAGGGADGAIHLVDPDTARAIRHFAPRAEEGQRGRLPTFPGVRALAFSPDGSVLVSGHDRFGGMHVWDPQTGREIAAPPALGGGYAVLAFSPDGATLAGGGDVGSTLVLWESATWRPRRKLDTRGFAERLGGFSADGRSLWTASSNELWRWDLATGRRAKSFTGHRGEIAAIAPFLHDLRVASAGEDGATILWTGAEPGTVRVATAPIDFRPEGLWGSLAAEDAAAAYDAIWAFAAVPDKAVAYLRNRLPRQAPADAGKVRSLLAQLDDESFAVRERATKELAQLSDAAEPLLREYLASTKSPEVAQRLEVLLDSAQQSAGDAETLRGLRAAEALERIATPDARAALEELATGVAGSRLKSRAREALRRLDAMPRH
jgi:sugar lactone lactonase YvrE